MRRCRITQVASRKAVESGDDYSYRHAHLLGVSRQTAESDTLAFGARAAAGDRRSRTDHAWTRSLCLPEFRLSIPAAVRQASAEGLSREGQWNGAEHWFAVLDSGTALRIADLADEHPIIRMIGTDSDRCVSRCAFSSALKLRCKTRRQGIEQIIATGRPPSTSQMAEDPSDIWGQGLQARVTK